MRSKLYTDLTQRQVYILCRIYNHYLGKPNDDRTPLYFEFVPESEIIKTWYPLVKSRLIMLLDWCDVYNPFGKVLYVKLASRGNNAVKNFLRVVREAPIELLPELLTSEFDFVREAAARRIQ